MQQVQIDPRTLEDVKCSKGSLTPIGACNNKNFKQVFQMKRVSALVSPSGKEEIITMPVFVCDKCGTECKELKKGA